MFMLIDEDIHNLTITYNANKQVRYLPLIFKDMRSIFDDKNLNNKIITYLSRYSIVSSLKIEEIKNKYIRDLLYSLLEQKTLNDYNFRLEKINKHLTNEYKLKRDLVLFLNKEMERRNPRNV